MCGACTFPSSLSGLIRPRGPLPVTPHNSGRPTTLVGYSGSSTDVRCDSGGKDIRVRLDTKSVILFVWRLNSFSRVIPNRRPTRLGTDVKLLWPWPEGVHLLLVNGPSDVLLFESPSVLTDLPSGSDDVEDVQTLGIPILKTPVYRHP